MSAPFNDNIPRERVVRDVREVEMRRDVHPSSLRSHDDDLDRDSGRYERVVRREYRAGNDWSVLLKWVFPAILLGLVISGLMPSHDMHLDHDHGLLERASDSIHSIGDRFNEGISFLSGKIMHRPTMTEKARKAAWEAKQGVKDRLDSVTDSSSDMADRVTGSFSYLGDKISRTADQAVRAVRNKFSSSSKGVDATVRQAQRRASSLGRDAQDTLDDVKDRAYELSREAQNKLYKAKDSLLDRFSSDDDDVDAEEYDYIRPTRHMHLGRHRHHEREWSDVIPDRVKNLAKRNTPRPTEKRTASKWSFFRMIREHPWISSLLALLAVLSIRPFFMSNDNSSTSGSMESTKRTALSGLALIIDRIGTFLGMIGDKVRHSENFSDLRRRSMDNQTSSDVRSDAPVSRTNVSSTVSADLPVDKTSSKVPEAPVESSKITDKSISTVPHNTHVAVKQTDFTRAKADQLKENLDSTQKAEGMQTPILGGR